METEMKKIMACGLALCLLSAALSGRRFRIVYPTEPDPGTGGTVEPSYGKETSPVQTTPADITSEEPPFQDQPIPGEEPDEPDKPSLEFHKFDLPNNDFDTGVMYAHDYDQDQVVLYMETWNEYITIQNVKHYGDYTAFLIDENTGIFIIRVYSAKFGNQLRVDRFQKGSSEIVSSIIETSVSLDYPKIFYYPLNDQTGYLAISGQTSVLDPNSGLYLGLHGTVLFFKTTDGGLTWQEVTQDRALYFSWHAISPAFFCMFTENIGIYALQYYGASAPIYITHDGWKTYEDVYMDLEELVHGACELIDCSYVDGKYMMTVEVYNGSGHDIIHCVSDDLIHWEVLPEPDGK